MKPWAQNSSVTTHPFIRSLGWLPRETAEAFADSPITDKDVSRVMRAASQMLDPGQSEALTQALNQKIFDRVGFNHEADIARMRYQQGTGLGQGNGHVPYNTFKLTWRELYDTAETLLESPAYGKAVQDAMKELSFLGANLPQGKEQAVLNMMSIECAALRSKLAGLSFKPRTRVTERPATLDSQGEVVSDIKDLYHDQTPGKKGAMTRQVRREMRYEGDEAELKQLLRDTSSILTHLGLLNNDKRADMYREAFHKNPNRADGVGLGKRAFVASRIMRDYNIGASFPAVEMDDSAQTLLALRRIALAADSIVSLKPFGDSTIDAFRAGKVVDRIKQTTRSVAPDGQSAGR